MSAVIEAVSDAFSGVVDAVGSAVEWVGDTVSNVVESALDDPVKAALQVGVIAATGGAGAAALGLSAPLTAMQAGLAMGAISGADVLLEGGDVEDALKSAATSFATSQAVSFGMDAFGSAGVPETVAGTTEFFDDGSSIQFFDDGSRIVTDTSGAVSATPAEAPPVATIPTEPVAPAQPVSEPASVQPRGAETFPVPTPAPVELQSVPEIGVQMIAPESPPFVTEIPPELLEPSMAEAALAAQQPDLANVPTSELETPTAAQPTKMTDANYPSLDDIISPPTKMTDANYPSLDNIINPEGAPIIDRSMLASELPQVVDKPLLDTLKDIGSSAIDYAKANPFTTAGIAAAGLAAMGGLGEEAQPQAVAEAKKTYTYGAPPEIKRTGLAEIASAAKDIYGAQAPATIPTTAPVAPPVFQSSFKPLLAGAAPGLASLGQGFAYTPVGGQQSFDISNLTPEQIVQLQDRLARTRSSGGR
jgi:hypothetical protein